jgi:uncharacterized membrane protein
VLVVLGILREVLISAMDLGGLEIDPDTGQLETGDFFGAVTFLSFALGFVQWVVGEVIAAGVTKGALDITYGRKPDVSTMFKGIDFVQVLIASFLTGLAVFIGILLCVIPGIIIAFLTSFTLYFVIDQKLSAVDAIKASIDFTRANVGDLVLLFLACIAAVIVGACLCGVGLLVAIPVVIIALAFAYRTLRGEQVAP